jgi:hypothetical protein
VPEHPLDQVSVDRTFRNLLATRRGTRHPDDRWLVLAHYDTVADSSGADDDASSVAVLLERFVLFTLLP